MDESRAAFKTNGHRVRRQDMRASNRQKSRIGDYLRGRPRAIKTTRINETSQRNQRIIWIMKWVLLLPLSAYTFIWFLLLVADFFKY